MFNKVSFENRAVYEIMWRNIVQLDTPQMTLRFIRLACWVPKATNTYSKYAITIAFKRQKWLHESDPMLRNKYIACDV